MKENRYKNPNYIDLEPSKDEIIEKYTKGISTKKIAKEYNCGLTTLSLKLNKWGIDKSKVPQFRGIGKNCSSWKGYNDIPRKFYTRAKDGAKRRNIEFDISIEEIWELFEEQNKKCSLSGINLKFDSFDGAYDGNASLDRKDSEKGYTKNNCQLLTKRVNNAKHDMLNQELLEIANDMVKFNQEEIYKDII